MMKMITPTIDVLPFTAPIRSSSPGALVIDTDDRRGMVPHMPANYNYHDDGTAEPVESQRRRSTSRDSGRVSRSRSRSRSRDKEPEQATTATAAAIVKRPPRQRPKPYKNRQCTEASLLDKSEICPYCLGCWTKDKSFDTITWRRQQINSRFICTAAYCKAGRDYNAAKANNTDRGLSRSEYIYKRIGELVDEGKRCGRVAGRGGSVPGAKQAAAAMATAMGVTAAAAATATTATTAVGMLPPVIIAAPPVIIEPVSIVRWSAPTTTVATFMPMPHAGLLVSDTY